MRIKLYPTCCILVSLLFLNSCSNYIKTVKKPGIYDGEKYGRVTLPSDANPFYFHKRTTNIVLPALSEWANEKEYKKFDTPEQLFEGSHTTAVLIIRNDSIIYENYYLGASETTVSQVFSVTKPLIASFLMQALEEGKINSLNEKVDQFFPIKKHNKNCEMLTLKHLANMQSGFNHYDYFRILKVLKLYYAKNIDEYIVKAKVNRAPGGKFKYKSIDTQILGSCLENIFKEESLLDRFVNLYWKNIHPENEGYFSVDGMDNKNLKYFGGLNASARDLAKIGKIYLDDGAFEGKQVISKEWLNYISDTTNHVGKWDYSMGWYFDMCEGNRNIFYGAGFNGQYLFINKDTNTIVIRLGESKDKHKWDFILSDLSALL